MILTIANQKGGAGKSTTAAALSQAAQHRGLACLAVDLDPQANLTLYLGGRSDDGKPGTLEVLTGECGAAESIEATPTGPDLIKGSWNLQIVSSSTGSAGRLKKALDTIAGKYDLIIIDTPPTAGELQMNALMASTDVIIPLQPDVGGLRGLQQLVNAARIVQRGNPALHVRGYILTRVTGRTVLEKQMTEQISSAAETLHVPYLMSVREAVAVREALTLQRDIFDYAPASKPAKDYEQLLNMLWEER